MQGNDPKYIEAFRLTCKFFPEAKATLSTEIGLNWDSFLGAMKLAHYQADYSCDPFRDQSDPDQGLSALGGLNGDDSKIYSRLISHARLRPSGRAIVIPSAIGTNEWTVDGSLPFVCHVSSIPVRLREINCFGQSLETIFVFETGEALLVDHDDRVHWARSRINQTWRRTSDPESPTQ